MVDKSGASTCGNSTPMAYINAAAVKKVVVGSRVGQCKVAPFACVAPVTIAVADQPLAPNCPL